MQPFRIGISAKLQPSFDSDGKSPLDTGPLDRDPRVELSFLPQGDALTAAETNAFDAVVLMQEALTAESFAPPARLSLAARYGVGYDKVDLAACTANGVLVANTPDGVRRPMAVGAITYLLVLSTRFPDKDRIARQGPEGWAQLSNYCSDRDISFPLNLRKLRPSPPGSGTKC